MKKIFLLVFALALPAVGFYLLTVVSPNRPTATPGAAVVPTAPAKKGALSASKADEGKGVVAPDPGPGVLEKLREGILRWSRSSSAPRTPRDPTVPRMGPDDPGLPPATTAGTIVCGRVYDELRLSPSWRLLPFNCDFKDVTALWGVVELQSSDLTIVTLRPGDKDVTGPPGFEPVLMRAGSTGGVVSMTTVRRNPR